MLQLSDEDLFGRHDNERTPAAATSRRFSAHSSSATFSHQRMWHSQVELMLSSSIGWVGVRGVALTRFIRSTKLLYAGPS